MRLRHRLTALLVAALALAIGRPGEASLILALDLPTIVARAERIAVVDVVSVQAAWNPRHDRIVSTIDVAVVDSWKGAAPPASHLKIVQPGGTVGDISMTVGGMPRFVTGERALLFLRGPVDRASVVGLAQGKRVVRRDASGRWMVGAPDRAGADFVRTAPQSIDAPVFDRRIRPLDEVRAEIQALAAHASGGAR